MQRKNIVLGFYAGLNVFIVTYLFVTLTNNFGVLLSAPGIVFWSTLVVFLGIPPFAILLWFLNRPVRKAHSGGVRAYLIISRLVAACAWLWSCRIPLMMVAFLNPWFWPLTMLDGPDTSYSKKHFEQCIGFAPPPSVSKVYYRNQSNMLDGREQLRFVCTDSAVLDRIIARHNLRATENRHSTVGARWWNIPYHDPDLQRFELDYYAVYTYLWFDPNTKTVWYEMGDR